MLRLVALAAMLAAPAIAGTPAETERALCDAALETIVAQHAALTEVSATVLQSEAATERLVADVHAVIEPASSDLSAQLERVAALCAEATP